MLSPVRDSSRSTVTLTLPVAWPLLPGSTRTRTWYCRGFGHSVPTKSYYRARESAGTVAGALGDGNESGTLVPPGRTAGAFTATAGSRNLSSLATLAWR